jgi:hypothetical protein
MLTSERLVGEFIKDHRQVRKPSIHAVNRTANIREGVSQ